MLKKLWTFVVLAIVNGPKAWTQTNLDFENGLEGWKSEPDSTSVQREFGEVYHGKSAIRLSAANAGISQQIAIPPLALVQYNAFLKSSDSGIPEKESQGLSVEPLTSQ